MFVDYFGYLEQLFGIIDNYGIDFPDISLYFIMLIFVCVAIMALFIPFALVYKLIGGRF